MATSPSPLGLPPRAWEEFIAHLVTPRMGAWKARFSFRPFRPFRQDDFASSDFAKWNSNTQLVQTSPKANAWAKNNSRDIEAKRAQYWPEKYMGSESI